MSSVYQIPISALQSARSGEKEKKKRGINLGKSERKGTSDSVKFVFDRRKICRMLFA